MIRASRHANVLTVPKPLPPELRAVAKELYLQGFKPEAISVKQGLPRTTIAGWIAKLGWKELRAKVVNAVSQQVAESRNPLAKASVSAQAAFSEELHSQAALLRSKPAKRLSDLSSTPKRQGRAAVVSTLVHAAAKLYGWDSSTSVEQHVSLTKVSVHTNAATTKQDGPAIDVPYE